MQSAQFSPPAENEVPPSKGKERALETKDPNSETYEDAAGLDKDAKHILVVGPTGAGKTSFIKLATGLDIEPGHTPETNTANVQVYPTTIDGKPISFIDTPGFSDFDSDTHVTVIKICHWLCENIFTGKKKLSGVLCLQDISTPKTTLAIQSTAEFLQALVGGYGSKDIVIATTKWDNVRESRISNFEARHNNLRTTAPWSQLIDSGAVLCQHFGIANTADDSDDDVQRAVQSKQDVLYHFFRSHGMDLLLREVFDASNDKGITASWLVNAIPILSRFSQSEATGKNVSSCGSTQQANRGQEASSEGYSTTTKVLSGLGAIVVAGATYYYRDDITRTVRRAHERLEKATSAEWSFWPWYEDGSFGIAGKGRSRGNFDPSLEQLWRR